MDKTPEDDATACHGVSVADTPAPMSMNEADRAAVIRAYDLAGYRDSGQLDDLAAFASELCDTPIALVSVVEEDVQQFLATVGIDADRTPRDTSFCAHVMVGRAETMVVPDARRDVRFADYSLVKGPPHIRFYAGARLLSREGVPLGAICVISPEPRPEGLTPFQRRGLEVLATAVMGRCRTVAPGASMSRRSRRPRRASPTASSASHPGRHHAANGLVDTARRLSRLLQCPLVRVYGHARRLDRWRGLERHVSCRGSGARLDPVAAQPGDGRALSDRISAAAQRRHLSLGAGPRLADPRCRGPYHPLVRHLHRHSRAEAGAGRARDRQPGAEPPDQEHLRGDFRPDRLCRAQPSWLCRDRQRPARPDHRAGPRA